ncbi:HutD family protein [Burkholderia vietnamiensis]|uniref:HutD/Ves family protein n=1 Tax=Burkholderia vietnamiensis TaxID=60552 RepID=UPI000F812C1F|nr:HutD family protein [Burkholderia vietnamiensis]
MTLIDVYPVESIPPEAWRNGGGTTRTIATGGNQWRVSMASIERDGPYSRFPGVARVSMILSGAGITLTSDEDVVHLCPFAAETYDGDVAWNAALVGGPCVALNVMTAKGRYCTHISVVDAPVVVRSGCTAIAVALGTGYTAAVGDETPGRDVGPGHVLVSEHHARPLRLAPRGVAAESDGQNACAALVIIEPAPVQKYA